MTRFVQSPSPFILVFPNVFCGLFTRLFKIKTIAVGSVPSGTFRVRRVVFSRRFHSSYPRSIIVLPCHMLLFQEVLFFYFLFCSTAVKPDNGLNLTGPFTAFSKSVSHSWAQLDPSQLIKGLKHFHVWSAVCTKLTAQHFQVKSSLLISDAWPLLFGIVHPGFSFPFGLRLT